MSGDEHALTVHFFRLAVFLRRAPSAGSVRVGITGMLVRRPGVVFRRAEAWPGELWAGCERVRVRLEVVLAHFFPFLVACGGVVRAAAVRRGACTCDLAAAVLAGPVAVRAVLPAAGDARLAYRAGLRRRRHRFHCSLAGGMWCRWLAPAGRGGRVAGSVVRGLGAMRQDRVQLADPVGGGEAGPVVLADGGADEGFAQGPAGLFQPDALPGQQGRQRVRRAGCEVADGGIDDPDGVHEGADGGVSGRQAAGWLADRGERGVGGVGEGPYRGDRSGAGLVGLVVPWAAQVPADARDRLGGCVDVDAGLGSVTADDAWPLDRAVLRELAQGARQFQQRHVQVGGDKRQLRRGRRLRPGAGGGFGSGGDLPRGSYGREVRLPFRREVAWHYRSPAPRPGGWLPRRNQGGSAGRGTRTPCLRGARSGAWMLI